MFAALVAVGVVAFADPALPELGHKASAAARASGVELRRLGAQGRAPGPGRDAKGAERRGAQYRRAKFADGRTGVVSLAVVNSEGSLRGQRENRRYAAASVVKAMLLAAEVRRLKKAGEGIDSATDSLLTSMITLSDNGAADSIYARVGDRACSRSPTARGCAIHRRRPLGQRPDHSRRHGAFLRRPRSVAPRRAPRVREGPAGFGRREQSWGIPDAAGDRWAVRFKGGWLPEQALVHQAAELRERDGHRELAIVVLTDDQPSFDYGIEHVRGVRLEAARAGTRRRIGIDTDS